MGLKARLRAAALACVVVWSVCSISRADLVERIGPGRTRQRILQWISAAANHEKKYKATIHPACRVRTCAVSMAIRAPREPGTAKPCPLGLQFMYGDPGMASERFRRFAAGFVHDPVATMHEGPLKTVVLAMTGFRARPRELRRRRHGRDCRHRPLRLDGPCRAAASGRVASSPATQSLLLLSEGGTGTGRRSRQKRNGTTRFVFAAYAAYSGYRPTRRRSSVAIRTATIAVASMANEAFNTLAWEIIPAQTKYKIAA